MTRNYIKILSIETRVLPSGRIPDFWLSNGTDRLKHYKGSIVLPHRKRFDVYTRFVGIVFGLRVFETGEPRIINLKKRV